MLWSLPRSDPRAATESLRPNGRGKSTNEGRLGALDRGAFRCDTPSSARADALPYCFVNEKHRIVRRLGATRAEVTQLGFGGAVLGNLFRAVPEANAREAVEAALSLGVRYFDTAPYYGYGLSEHRIGAALRTGARAEFQLSTKVGRLLHAGLVQSRGTEFCDPLPFGAVFDYGYDATWRSLEDSLQRLGLGRIDVALLHDLDPTVHEPTAHARYLDQARDGALRALAEMREQGIVSAIGLGINDWRAAERFVRECALDVVLLAGRYTLLEHEAAVSFFPECIRRGVSVVIGGPFNSGVLAGGRQGAYDYAPAPDPIRERVARLCAVCERHGVPLAAAALQFPLGQPAVVSVIPGMRSAAEVRENVRLFNATVPSSLWEELRSEELLPAEVPIPA